MKVSREDRLSELPEHYLSDSKHSHALRAEPGAPSNDLASTQNLLDVYEKYKAGQVDDRLLASHLDHVSAMLHRGGDTLASSAAGPPSHAPPPRPPQKERAAHPLAQANLEQLSSAELTALLKESQSQRLGRVKEMQHKLKERSLQEEIERAQKLKAELAEAGNRGGQRRGAPFSSGSGGMKAFAGKRAAPKPHEAPDEMEEMRLMRLRLEAQYEEAEHEAALATKYLEENTTVGKTQF